MQILQPLHRFCIGTQPIFFHLPSDVLCMKLSKKVYTKDYDFFLNDHLPAGLQLGIRLAFCARHWVVGDFVLVIHIFAGAGLNIATFVGKQYYTKEQEMCSAGKKHHVDCGRSKAFNLFVSSRKEQK